MRNQTGVAFLVTRVRKPDEDDWGKLKRMLEYLKGHLQMPLILSADSLTCADGGWMLHMLPTKTAKDTPVPE